MVSNSNHAHAKSTALLLLSINLAILISFFTVRLDASPSVSVGIRGEGVFVYALYVAVIMDPASNVQSTPLVNLAGLRDDSVASTCSGLLPDIRACQSQGVKVFLSLNSNGSSSSVSQDAQQLSDYLWNTFLGGQSNSRPFGEAVFDGINFDIQAGAGSGQFWADVATSLKAHSSSSQLQKKVYLSATVPCLFPADAHLAGDGLFDYVWVRFYNNWQCEYGANADALLAAWNRWTTQVSSSRIFLGLPAAPGAARSGYIPPNLLTSTVLPFVKTSPKYGGVMLWDTFYDQQTGYSAAIKNSV